MSEQKEPQAAADPLTAGDEAKTNIQIKEAVSGGATPAVLDAEKPPVVEDDLKNKAAQIKAWRIEGKQPGYTWNEVDKLLADQRISPGTPEADKFMQEWDANRAKEILETENKKEIAKTEEAFLPIEELRKNMTAARIEQVKSEIDLKKSDKRSDRLKEVLKSIFRNEHEDKIAKENLAKEKEAINKINEEKQATYEEAKKVFAKGVYEERLKLFEQRVKTGGKDGGAMEAKDQEKALAELKFEIVKMAVLEEKENFNKAKMEALPEKERGMCRKVLAKYGDLPQWSKVLISASVATGAAFAFSSGAGLAMFGSVFAWKILRAAAGTTAGVLAGKGYNWAFNKIVDVKNIKTKGEQEIINEIQGTLAKKKTEMEVWAEGEDKKEEFDKWFSELASSTNQKLDDLAAKEKRILLGKAIGQGIVVAGVAGLTSVGLEKAMAGVSPDIASKVGIKSSATPENRPVKAAGAADNAAGGKVASAADTNQIEAGGAKAAGAVDGAIRPGRFAAGAESLAEIKKGDGIETVLIRQLKAFGLTPEQAGTEAHKIAMAKGWVKIDEAGKMVETRVFFDAKNPAKYLLERDPAGKFNVIEANTTGKTYLWSAPEEPKETPVDLGETKKELDLPKKEPDIPKADAQQAPPPPVKDAGLQEIINKRVEPELYKDKTYLAYKDKITVRQLVTDFPKEVTDTEYGLTQKWHKDALEGGFSGDRYGNMTYGDAEKMKEMSKFVNEMREKGLIKDIDLDKKIGEVFDQPGAVKKEVGSIATSATEQREIAGVKKAELAGGIKEAKKITPDNSSLVGEKPKVTLGGDIPEKDKIIFQNNIKDSVLSKLTGKTLNQFKSLDELDQSVLIDKMKGRLREISSEASFSSVEAVAKKNNIANLKLAISTLERYKKSGI